jgi:type VI protein secretion system component VasK
MRWASRRTESSAERVLLLGVIGLVAIVAGWLFLRRNEARLEAEAERAQLRTAPSRHPRAR